MRSKLQEIIAKIISILITYTQVLFYHNKSILISIYFGSGIIELITGKEKELIRIYKVLLLRKL